MNFLYVLIDKALIRILLMLVKNYHFHVSQDFLHHEQKHKLNLHTPRCPP